MTKPLRFNLTKKIAKRDPVVEEIYQWLNEHVGLEKARPRLTSGQNYDGDGWKVVITPMSHGRFKPQYFLSFDDINHAVLFKLRWSALI
jgi:hypothetical protein